MWDCCVLLLLIQVAVCILFVELVYYQRWYMYSQDIQASMCLLLVAPIVAKRPSHAPAVIIVPAPFLL